MYKLSKIKSMLGVASIALSSSVLASTISINFDVDLSGSAISAPDLFSTATPLTNLYSAQGVNFSALDRIQVTSQIHHNGVLKTVTRNELMPTNSGMGAILNDSSGFRGPAKSGDNFLAFNGETAFGSHFWRISFDDPIGYFEINRRKGASPDNNYYSHLDAYDSEGNLVGSRNNIYAGIDSWSGDAGWSGYKSSFKSETEISYVDIGHALYSGSNANSSFRPTPWSIVYDDLVFGEFADASSGTQFLSGGGSFIPLPGSIWFLLTGLLGFGGLARKRKLTDE